MTQRSPLRTVRTHRGGAILALLALFIGLCRPCEAQGAELAEDGAVIYEVQPGDTLQEICERFLGGNEYLPELLGHNRIADPNTISAGSLLAIPREERTDAITALSRAENALAQAIDAAAETYAEQEFRDARRAVENSRQSREQGEYSQSLATARVGLLLANRARKLADERAPVEQDATLTAVHRTVETTTDGGDTWLAAKQGDRIGLGMEIRTGSDSRAEITLADGSVLQVNAESRFAIQRFVLDRRDGMRTSRLKVIMGSILGHVEPRKVDTSEFEIDAGEASVAIRGTELRVEEDQGTSRLAVYGGNTSMRAGGKEVEVPEDFGTVSRGGRPPAPPEKLLSPPIDLSPRAVIHRTANQRPAFQWQPHPARPAAAYLLEIATDTAFNRVEQGRRVERPGLRADVLPAGTYFWHVASIDDKGLIGEYSRFRRLEIRKEYGVRVMPSEVLISTQGRKLAQPDVTYAIRPSKEDTSVVAVYYSMDGDVYRELDGRFTLPDDGDYVIHVKGRCAEGQYGEPQSFEVRVDGTPPEVTAVVSAPIEDPALGEVVFLEITGRDENGVARLEISTNGKTFAEYVDPVAFRPDERHRVAYRAHDIVGNVSPVATIEVGARP